MRRCRSVVRSLPQRARDEIGSETVLDSRRVMELHETDKQTDSPGDTKTNLNGYEGTETLEEGAREAVRRAARPGQPDRYVHTLGKRTDPLVICSCL
jgi:hypothetical protein